MNDSKRNLFDSTDEQGPLRLYGMDRRKTEPIEDYDESAEASAQLNKIQVSGYGDKGNHNLKSRLNSMTRKPNSLREKHKMSFNEGQLPQNMPEEVEIEDFPSNEDKSP